MLSFNLFRGSVQKVALILVLGLGVGTLSSCGFEPLHGSANSVDNSLGSTRIQIISERNGQMLHNHLRDKLNPEGLAPNPLYGLTVALKTKTRTTGFTSEQSATYATIIATAEYSLFKQSDKEEVYSGTAEAVTSYNKFVMPYTNRYTERDATERALAALSEDIYNGLSTYFATNH